MQTSYTLNVHDGNSAILIFFIKIIINNIKAPYYFSIIFSHFFIMIFLYFFCVSHILMGIEFNKNLNILKII